MNNRFYFVVYATVYRYFFHFHQFLIASALHSYELHEEPDRAWGMKKDGKYIGMLGQLYREDTDVAMPLGPTRDRFQVMNYCKTNTAKGLTIVSRKPSFLPQHLLILRPLAGKGGNTQQAANITITHAIMRMTARHYN